MHSEPSHARNCGGAYFHAEGTWLVHVLTISGRSLSAGAEPIQRPHAPADPLVAPHWRAFPAAASGGELPALKVFDFRSTSAVSYSSGSEPPGFLAKARWGLMIFLAIRSWRLGLIDFPTFLCLRPGEFEVRRARPAGPRKELPPGEGAAHRRCLQIKPSKSVGRCCLGRVGT